MENIVNNLDNGQSEPVNENTNKNDIDISIKLFTNSDEKDSETDSTKKHKQRRNEEIATVKHTCQPQQQSSTFQLYPICETPNDWCMSAEGNIPPQPETEQENLKTQSSTSWIIDMSKSTKQEEQKLPDTKPSQDAKSSSFFIYLSKTTTGSKETSIKCYQTLDSKFVDRPVKQIDLSTFKNIINDATLPKPPAQITLPKEPDWNSMKDKPDFGTYLAFYTSLDLDTDVVILVSGRQIQAHKCILAARCQYFAGLLAGGFVESAGNNIVMPPFSYNSVLFALCVIYSGKSTIPEDIDIKELSDLANLLCFESLKDKIMDYLQRKYCHNFHDPCSECMDGVLVCLQLSSKHALEDLAAKCFQWITKNFHVLWPAETFNNLPKFLIDRCYKWQLRMFSLENFLSTLNGIAILEAMPKKERRGICDFGYKLMYDLADLVAVNLREAIERIVLNIMNIPHNNIAIVHICITSAISNSTLDQIIKSYAYIKDVSKIITISQTWSNVFRRWHYESEVKLLNLSRDSINTEYFRNVPENIKLKLRDEGYIFGIPSPPPLVLPKSPKTISKSLEYVRVFFTPYCEKPLGAEVGFMSNELVMQSPVKMTPAQLERFRRNPMRYVNTEPRHPRKKTGKVVNKNTGHVSADAKCVATVKQVAGHPSSATISQSSLAVATSNTRPNRNRPNNANLNKTWPNATRPNNTCLNKTWPNNKTQLYSASQCSTSTTGSCITISSTRSPIAASKITKENFVTKIPIATKYIKTPVEVSPVAVKPSSLTSLTVSQTSSRLMTPTQSSLAKQQVIGSKTTSAKKQIKKKEEPLPAMNRSGTFSKDAPTFGDKTTRID